MCHLFQCNRVLVSQVSMGHVVYEYSHHTNNKHGMEHICTRVPSTWGMISTQYMKLVKLVTCSTIFSDVNLFIDLVKHRAHSYRAISDTFIRYVTIKISHFLMKST